MASLDDLWNQAAEASQLSSEKQRPAPYFPPASASSMTAAELGRASGAPMGAKQRQRPSHAAPAAAVPTQAGKRKGDQQGRFKEGDTVGVAGLRQAQELNGQQGTLCSWDHSTQRWHVRLDSGGEVRVRPENLRAVAAAGAAGVPGGMGPSHGGQGARSSAPLVSSKGQSKQPRPSPSDVARASRAPVLSPHWRGRNITADHKAEEGKTRQANDAMAERHRAEQQLAACDRKILDLRIHVGVHGTSSEFCSRACQEASTAASKNAKAREEEHRGAVQELGRLQARAKGMGPGPELLDITKFIHAANSRVESTKRACEEAKKLATERRRAQEAAIDLEQQLSQRKVLQQRFATASAKAERAGRVVQPLLGEMEVAERDALLCSSTPCRLARRDAAREQTVFALMDLLDGLSCEWAVSLAPQRAAGVRDDAEIDVRYFPLDFVLSLAAPTPAREECILHLAPSVNAREEDVKAGPCFVKIKAGDIVELEKFAAKPTTLPTGMEVVGAALGMECTDVALDAPTRRAVLSALSPKTQEAPDGFRAKLREYQHEGFQWLVTNAQNGIGCLLADDMGLGKTVQTSALLLHLHERGKIKETRPALVVSPASVMAVWQRELAAWAPQLQCRSYHGSLRGFHEPSEEEKENGGTAPTPVIFLTTYATLQRDVLDESDHSLSLAGLLRVELRHCSGARVLGTGP